ncbi:glycosyltransferase family 4 protein [Dactylosporangium siamense]|uniref:Glycosyl transferase n=1 Tax=Dactylosporangium siamense TaxID=685454 RepID=A0A919PDT4_9ACTN|nr:glycosyltransferase family 4 protein [Dactylosporangium siamense]GIG42946.1 glycosyl transferase [Dactylosporangium siamense]
MRIAHVTDFFLPRLGGIEMQVHDLAVRQQAAGHEVEIITTTPGGPADDGELRVHRLSERLWLLPAEVRPGVLRAGRELLLNGRYDVLHVHAGPASPLAFAAAALADRVPTVVTIHSLLSHLEHAFRALDTASGWTRWPAVWTAVSDVAAAPLQRLVWPMEVHVLPNGIDTDRWRVDPHPADPAGVLVVAVMRLAARKRPMQLLRLLRQARATLPAAAGLRVVIAGEGPRRPAMERFLRRHGMTGWVSLPGRLSRPQIRSLFAQSDLFVAPAILESFGIAALEARCAGLPVVARAEGGIGQLIADGREGVLVDSDAAMADAIAALVMDPARRGRIAAHNLATSPPVAWPDVLARTTGLYELAAAHRAPIGAGA